MTLIIFTSCVPDAVDGRCSFLDTLQQVPQLLNTCVDCCGLKTLRQVCKTARSITIQAVRGYCVKVSSQPSETEPLRQVATLLEHSRLQHLSVEVTIEAGSVCGLTTHELSSHIAQLSDFFCVMGPALRKVSRLDIICTIPLCSTVYPPKTTSGCLSVAHRHTLPKVAESSLASLLAAACPEVVKVGTGGCMSEGLIRLLCELWPKLTSVKVLGGILPDAVFKGLFQGSAGSRVTHLDISTFVPLNAYLKDSLHTVLHHSLLTHLTLGMQESDNAKLWMLLPAQLKVLHGNTLPCQLPLGLHLARLECMHFKTSRSVYLPADVLASLLRSAPSLKLLSIADAACNTLCIADCSYSDMASLRTLHQRISTGLTLTGIHVGCGRFSQPINGDSCLPLKEVLSGILHLSAFGSVRISSWQIQDRAGCLPLVAQVFPMLRKLFLDGRWTDAEVEDVGVFKSLHELYVMDSALLALSVLHLVGCMPDLRHLHHNISGGNGKSDFQQAFLDQLKATQVVHAGGSIVGGLGDWGLVKELDSSTVWSRVNTATNEFPAPESMWLQGLRILFLLIFFGWPFIILGACYEPRGSH